MIKAKSFVALGMFALSMSAATAADTGWYAGGGGGYTTYNGDAVGLAPPLASETYTVTRIDDDSTGWKLFGGYKFHKNWAVELAYVDLGKFSMDANVSPGLFGIGTEYAEAKPTCWNLSAVGILPLRNNFSLLGKLGVCAWDDHPRVEETILGVVTPESGGVESSGTDLTYGLGFQYDLSKNVGLRAEWERFDNVIHDRNHVDLWSVSLQYSF